MHVVYLFPLFSIIFYLLSGIVKCKLIDVDSPRFYMQRTHTRATLGEEVTFRKQLFSDVYASGKDLRTSHENSLAMDYMSPGQLPL